MSEKPGDCLHCVICDAIAVWSEKHYGKAEPDGVKVLGAVGNVAVDLLNQVPIEQRAALLALFTREVAQGAGLLALVGRVETGPAPLEGYEVGTKH